MKLFGNIIWLIFGGLLSALSYFFASFILAITIIGIPFAVQTFKIGVMELFPFGSEVISNDETGGGLSLIMNVLWVFVGGFWIAMIHVFFGILFAITIIGLPFAYQHFKLARLSLFPFGKTIIDKQ